MRLAISPERALLGFLLNGPMHGYDLSKQVNAHLGLVWTLRLSQLYAIVKTFETRGWVRTHVRSQSKRPSQKVLELTPAGRAAFEEWLRQPAHGLREFRVDFFLRLYFAQTTGGQFAQGLVAGQIAACREEWETLRSRRAEAGAAEQDLYRLARDFRITQLTAILKWLESHRAQLIQPSQTREQALPRLSRRESKALPPNSGNKARGRF